MADFSFDVVSKVDLNLIEEAISVAKKEVTNRYDFKGSNPNIELLSKESLIKISCGDEYKVKALYDILLTRLAKKRRRFKKFPPAENRGRAGRNGKTGS